MSIYGNEASKRNVFLEKYDFKDITFYQVVSKKAGYNGTTGTLIGHQTIKGEDVYVVVMGANASVEQCSSNFVVATNRVETILNRYISEHKSDKKRNFIFMGYSCSAAIANILGADSEYMLCKGLLVGGKVIAVTISDATIKTGVWSAVKSIKCK